MTATIVMLGTVTIACAVIEKILMETPKAHWCQFINLFGISSLAITALTGVLKLFSTIKGL